MVDIASNTKNEPLLKGFGTSLGFGAVMSGGFGSVSSIKTNKGLKGAFNQTKLSNDAINEFLKKNPNADIFTRNYAAAKNYEEYSRLVKSAKKAQKTLEAAQNGKFSLWQRIKNLGKNSDDIIKSYKSTSEAAQEALKTAQKALKEGKEITKVKILSQGLKANTKALFTQELLEPVNLLYAVTSIYSRIKEEAIPVFKEQGKVAGIKQLFISTGKSIADVVSNAGFSAVFRMIGSTAGKFFGPVGSALGGFIGDLFGTFLSNKIICKIFKDDEKSEQNFQKAQDEFARQEENIPIQKQIPYNAEYDPNMERIERKLRQLNIAI